MASALVNKQQQQNKKKKVSMNFYSVELWAKTEHGDDELAAAELGFSVGAVYTSMTEFCNKKYNSAGTIQLVALSCLLQVFCFFFMSLFFFPR